MDVYDAEMSGKFALHFQKNVVAFKIMPSHGTSLVFAISGWGASDCDCDCAVDDLHLPYIGPLISVYEP